jgi:hypothetical protein
MSISHGTRLVHKGERRPLEAGFIVNADTTVLALEGKEAETLRQRIAGLGEYVTYITAYSPDEVGTRLKGQPRHRTELGREALLGTLHKAWRFLSTPTELTLVTGIAAKGHDNPGATLPIDLVTYPMGRMPFNRASSVLTPEVLREVFPQVLMAQPDSIEQAASNFVLAGPANTIH